MCLYRTRGAALILLVLALALAFTTLLLTSMGKGQQQIKADKTTQEALRMAREALINSALGFPGDRDLTRRNRPGELLCPDRNLPGSADEGTEGAGGLSNCTGNAQLFRRLPWKSLGLSQYKDGYGEPLWYMVVAPFEAQPNTAALNSSTLPAPTSNLRAFADAGRIELGSATNPVIAIVFAPGPALAGQNRNTTAQQNSPSNYLESVAPPNATAAFDNANTNPAIQRVTGPIKDAAGNVVLNDQLVVIRREDIMNRLAPNGRRYGIRPRAIAEYPAALAARGIAPACSVGANPPPITRLAAASDFYNWLGQNNWDTVLTYKSCSPITLQ